MRIAVDAMGGEKAPEAIVQGALESAKQEEVEVVLVGDEKRIRKELTKYNLSNFQISLKSASQVTGMDELPVEAWKQKKDSSIAVAVDLVKKKEADALVSAGNTGAVITTMLMDLGRLEGIIRPAIATLMPTLEGVSILLDVGANVDSKPKHLLQFAIMGDTYAKYILEKHSPRIGLLSVGKEASKGNELIKETYKLLKSAPLNFIGNVEGGDIVNGKADVVVCDGFIGNVVLKASEGVAEVINRSLKEEISKNFFSKVGGCLIKSAYKELQKKTDCSEYGGAPLLGVNGVGVIAHGASSAKAIKNAVRAAKAFVNYQINKHIVENIKNYG